MPRPLRIQAAGIRHVTCRGNRRQAIFLDDDDRERYLGILGEVSARFGWRVLTWCQMSNHLHLVVEVPEGTISRGMQQLSGDYGASFNWRHGFTGHLFQERFHDEFVLDDAYFKTVLPYVDLNPVRAGRVGRAWEWSWSGCRALLGLERPRPFHDVDRALRLVRADPEKARVAYANLLASWREHDLGARRTVALGHGRGLTPDMAWMDVAAVRLGGQPTP